MISVIGIPSGTVEGIENWSPDYFYTSVGLPLKLLSGVHINRDRSCRFEDSGRSKFFLSLMSFDSLWDIQMCKQKLFTMHND